LAIPGKKNLGRRPPQFELIAGAVCLDFVNTLDDRFSEQPKELLPSYADLARFAEEAGILEERQSDHLIARSKEYPQEAQRVLRDAVRMREAMHDVFWARAQKKAVPKASLSVLNEYVQDSARHASLVPRNGHFEWQFDPSPDHLDAPLWPIARSASELLASDRLEFVRACASESCDWLFLDESKNHGRRWCDMTKCGNRAKVRSFYRRQKGEMSS